MYWKINLFYCNEETPILCGLTWINKQRAHHSMFPLICSADTQNVKLK